MAANSLVQTRIDPDVKERATVVLSKMGLTVSDAVRILLTRVAAEGALPIDFAVDKDAHDQWFKARVMAALEDSRPTVPNDDVAARFTKRRDLARRRSKEHAP